MLLSASSQPCAYDDSFMGGLGGSSEILKKPVFQERGPVRGVLDQHLTLL